MNHMLTVALVVVILGAAATEAATRCRTTRMGSTTYTTCEGGPVKTECRSHRVGSTTYTTCR